MPEMPSHDSVPLTPQEETTFAAIEQRFTEVESQPVPGSRIGRTARIARRVGITALGVALCAGIGYVGVEIKDIMQDAEAVQADHDRLRTAASDPIALRYLGVCSLELAAQQDWNTLTHGQRISPQEQFQRELVSTALHTAYEAKLPCVIVTGAEHVVVDGKTVNRSDFTIFSKINWCQRDRGLLPKVADSATLQMNDISKFFFDPTCDTAVPPQSYSPYTEPQVELP